jgi:membrane protein YqaA with SNARE-associated domain
MPPLPLTTAGIWLATFGFSVAGGIVPLLSIEAYVLMVSAASPQTEVLPVAFAAALGQMVAKSLVYLTGTGVVKLPLPGGRDRINRLAARLDHSDRSAMVVILTSALASVPPFYAVSLAAGALHLRFARFFAVGCAGGLVRFAALFSLPRLLL